MAEIFPIRRKTLYNKSSSIQKWERKLFQKQFDKRILYTHFKDLVECENHDNAESSFVITKTEPVYDVLDKDIANEY